MTKSKIDAMETASNAIQTGYAADIFSACYSVRG
jgi:hypothetical protein